MVSSSLHHQTVVLQVDVYSFGIVMWELLTGEEPYAKMHCGEIIGNSLSSLCGDARLIAELNCKLLINLYVIKKSWVWLA